MRFNLLELFPANGEKVKPGACLLLKCQFDGKNPQSLAQFIYY